MRLRSYPAIFFALALTASAISIGILPSRILADSNPVDSLFLFEPEPPRAGSHLESFRFRSLADDLVIWDESAKSLKINDSAYNYKALIIHVFQPDCGKCKALAIALQDLRAQFSNSDVFVIGIAHRKQLAEIRTFAREHNLTYPIMVATDTKWARRWGRGDPMYIVDSSGLVVYSQTGFNSNDPESWGYVVGDLIGGRRNMITEARRKRFNKGDTLPTMRLPSLEDLSPMILSVADNKLSLTTAGAGEQNYRASIGFFSRF